MPYPRNHVPTLRLHKPSGQAIVTLSGEDHYLGPHGTQVSRDAYDRAVAEWLARGRRPLPRPDPPAISVNELILRFWEHAKGYYRRADGTTTSEVENFRQAMRPLRALYGSTAAADFGPKMLGAVRETMIARGWSRKNINKQIDRLRFVFRWAASEELLAEDVYRRLGTLLPLRKGRTTAPEPEPVRPVPQAQIDAIRPFVSRQVWAMIQLQLHTAARPGEIVRLRPTDLATAEKVWTARPASHKTAYRELPRTLYFGPRAQEILREFLVDCPVDAFLFSPLEAEAERRERRHAARKTPLSCGNRPGTQRQASPERRPRSAYTVDSYRRAIERGCDLAFPLPGELAPQKVKAARGWRLESRREWRGRLGAENWAVVKAWWKEHRWHPHRLRHSAATFLRKEFGIEIARVILGHRSASVTEIYAEVDEAKARQAIERVG